MARGPAGLKRPLIQGEYAIIIEVMNGLTREKAIDIADILRSVYGESPDIVPSSGGDAIALITSDQTKKKQLDSVENKIANLSSMGETQISIKPA